MDFGLKGIARHAADQSRRRQGLRGAGLLRLGQRGVGRDKQPIFKPWVVLNKSFKATDAGGKAVDVTLKVGVIGFAPPPILQWDKANLEGHVEVTGWKETAARYVPEMKAAPT